MVVGTSLACYTLSGGRLLATLCRLPVRRLLAPLCRCFACLLSFALLVRHL